MTLVLKSYVHPNIPNLVVLVYDSMRTYALYIYFICYEVQNYIKTKRSGNSAHFLTFVNDVKVKICWCHRETTQERISVIIVL